MRNHKKQTSVRRAVTAIVLLGLAGVLGLGTAAPAMADPVEAQKSWSHRGERWSDDGDAGGVSGRVTTRWSSSIYAEAEFRALGEKVHVTNATNGRIRVRFAADPTPLRGPIVYIDKVYAAKSFTTEDLAIDEDIKVTLQVCLEGGNSGWRECTTLHHLYT